MQNDLVNEYEMIQKIAREIIEASKSQTEATLAFQAALKDNDVARLSLADLYLERNCRDVVRAEWIALKRELENYAMPPDCSGGAELGCEDVITMVEPSNPPLPAQPAVISIPTVISVSPVKGEMSGGGNIYPDPKSSGAPTTPPKPTPIQRDPILGGKKGADIANDIAAKTALDIMTPLGKRAGSCTQHELFISAKKTLVHAKFFEAMANQMPPNGEADCYFSGKDADTLLHTIRSEVGCATAAETQIRRKQEKAAKPKPGKTWSRDDIYAVN